MQHSCLQSGPTPHYRNSCRRLPLHDALVLASRTQIEEPRDQVRRTPNSKAAQQQDPRPSAGTKTICARERRGRKKRHRYRRELRRRWRWPRPRDVASSDTLPPRAASIAACARALAPPPLPALPPRPSPMFLNQPENFRLGSRSVRSIQAQKNGISGRPSQKRFSRKILLKISVNSGLPPLPRVGKKPPLQALEKKCP
jgi:hypothetical protein